MKLRVRIALLVGMTVAVTVAAVTALAAWSAERELLDPVDDRLVAGIAVFQEIAASPDARTPQRPLVLDRDSAERGAFARRLGARDADPFGVLVVDADGNPVALLGSQLPATIHESFEVRSPAGAVGGQDSTLLFTSVVDDREFRVARSSAGESTVYLGQDVTSLRDSLGALRRRLLTVGGLGVVAAVALGWVIAQRVARPITRVADAAGALADNQSLPDRIDTRRRDEVGDLATSFNRLLDALETSRAQQRRLVSDASHELRTPLTSLRLRIEMLGHQPDMGAEQRALLIDAAVRELAMLTALVSELVDLATDLEHVQEQPVSTMVGSIVVECVEGARLRSGRTIEVSTDDAVLIVSPRLYARAVSNLIDNALKYSPSQAAVVVAQSAGRVEVVDAGDGVSAEERRLVFNRFYRSPNAQLLPGSGIGLAIVRHAAQMHEGEVWFEANEGRGSRVGFSVS